MSKVLLAFTMSLDGFIAGPNVSKAYPLGEGGQHLHEWLFKGSNEEPDASMGKRNVRTRRSNGAGEAHLPAGAVGNMSAAVVMSVVVTTPAAIRHGPGGPRPLRRRVGGTGRLLDCPVPVPPPIETVMLAPFPAAA